MRNPFKPKTFEGKWLPPVMGLEFFEGEPPDYLDRGYYFQEIPVHVTVSEVIDKRTVFAKKIHEETKHEWQPRGNTAHACLEAHFRGRSYDAGNYKDLVNHLVNFWLWEEWEAIGVEYRMIDRHRNIAGTADMILRNREDHRRIAVADLKTCKTKINRRDISAQLGGYINLLNLSHFELDVTDAFGIWACPTKTDVEAYDPIDCVTTYEGIRDGFLKQKREF